LRELNLLVCADFHGCMEAADMIVAASTEESYDAVVVCGDFSTFGSTSFASSFLKRIEKRVLAVPGNCDVPDTVAVLEQANASVHNMRVNLHDWSFFGFGGGLPSDSGMPFEIAEDIVERSLRAIASPGGIMVTHTPAYGMNDAARGGRNLGSEGILRVANEFKPVLAISGHVHESRGKVVTMDTTFVNPGPAKNGFYASIRVSDVAEVRFHEIKLKKNKPTTF
jgi:Icc-related predicted phosphoesterase